MKNKITYTTDVAHCMGRDCPIRNKCVRFYNIINERMFSAMSVYLTPRSNTILKPKSVKCLRNFRKRLFLNIAILKNKILNTNTITKMKQFNSQVCTTIEQSQRLLELGLKPETADMYHTTFYRDNVGYEIIQVRNKKLPLLSQELPAWSLHRLIEIRFAGDNIGFGVYNIHGRNFGNCYEILISVIEYLIEIGEFNKEYLKQ